MLRYSFNLILLNSFNAAIFIQFIPLKFIQFKYSFNLILLNSFNLQYSFNSVGMRRLPSATCRPKQNFIGKLNITQQYMETQILAFLSNYLGDHICFCIYAYSFPLNFEQKKWHKKWVQVVYMDRNKVNRLAGILQQASEVLRSIDEPHESTTSNNMNSTTSTRTSTESDCAAPSRDGRGRSMTTLSPAVSAGNSTTEALSRARQMMTASSNSGLYRRLNRNERLRATASPSTARPKKKAKIEKKPFEFALIKI